MNKIDTCEYCGSRNQIRWLAATNINLCVDCYNRPQPKIICLCGSTRFFQDFADTNLEETLKGNIVLSIGANAHDNDLPLTEEQKRRLDRLHMMKIKMADEIIVLNRDGYVGESTTREIAMAKKLGKKVIYKFGSAT